MGRLSKQLPDLQQQKQQAVEEEVGEIEALDGRPDNIPKHVWDLMQENGELATVRLNEILSSARFARLRPGDQAKLIELAQKRAYGNYVTNEKQDKRGMTGRDATAHALNNLVEKATLPEFKSVAKKDIDDAEIL